uniref:C2H2-type domain-containing protein n=1 Tax=Panagrolaimus sp. PS1159 TaxID=55785 RepID=A0AC35F294_9BILA
MPRKHIQSNKVRKRKAKDLDEIQEEMKPEKIPKKLTAEEAYDLPGNGEFHCIACCRYFADDDAYKRHVKSNPHKRQLKRLKEPAYTQAEANLAAGLGEPTN